MFFDYHFRFKWLSHLSTTYYHMFYSCYQKHLTELLCKKIVIINYHQQINCVYSETIFFFLSFWAYFCFQCFLYCFSVIINVWSYFKLTLLLLNFRKKKEHKYWLLYHIFLKIYITFHPVATELIFWKKNFFGKIWN